VIPLVGQKLNGDALCASSTSGASQAMASGAVDGTWKIRTLSEDWKVHWLTYLPDWFRQLRSLASPGNKPSSVAIQNF
jgi:hypothetical protein